MARKHRLHTQGPGQRNDFLAGVAMAHQQTRRGVAAGQAQLCIEVDKGVADELHPPVRAGQGIEDLAVENEGAVNPPAGVQRERQGCVVVDAQITTEPHQATGKFFFHSDR